MNLGATTAATKTPYRHFFMSKAADAATTIISGRYEYKARLSPEATTAMDRVRW